MAFITETLTVEDNAKFNLPYAIDLENPNNLWRTWVTDRERDVYLTGVGVTGNQAFDDDIKMIADFYLGFKKFEIILEPSITPGDFKANPYSIHYPALLKIWVFISPERGMIDVLPTVRSNPDEPHALLQNRSLNEFIALFKEALIEYKEGYYNKFIKAPIDVSFGF